MKRLQQGLSKRQRQILEAVYRLKEASVGEIRAAIPDAPSYSAVRTTMNILAERRLLKRTLSGRKYLYAPTIPHGRARQSAVQHLLRTYFNDSVGQAVAALLQSDPKGLSEEDYQSLLALIEKARDGG